MLRFNKHYFLLTVILFVIEVLIALYVHDTIVRPYVGDILVVMLIYCFIRAFLNTKIVLTAVFVLLFAFGIETLQFINIVNRLKLEYSEVARTAIGTSFAWMDIACYIVGILIVLAAESMRLKNNYAKTGSK